MGVHQNVLLPSVIYLFYLQNAEIFGFSQRVPTRTVMLIADAKHVLLQNI